MVTTLKTTDIQNTEYMKSNIDESTWCSDKYVLIYIVYYSQNLMVALSRTENKFRGVLEWLQYNVYKNWQSVPNGTMLRRRHLPDIEYIVITATMLQQGFQETPLT